MADNPKGPSSPRWQRPDSTSAEPRRISRRAFVGRSAGAALAISGVSSFLTSGRAASQTGSGTVVVMAWENYVHPEIQKRFHDGDRHHDARHRRGLRSGHVHQAEGRRRRPVRYRLRECRLLSLLPRGRSDRAARSQPDTGGEESVADLQDEYRLSLRPRAEQDAALPEHVGFLRNRAGTSTNSRSRRPIPGSRFGTLPRAR